MGLLAVLCLPVALTPGLLLALLQPAIALLVPGAERQPFAYAPLPLAIAMLVMAGLAFLLLQRFGVRGEREVTAWNGGFGTSPAWLPFGDPVTQPTATGFAEPVRRVLGSVLSRDGGDPGEKYLLGPVVRPASGVRAAGRADPPRHHPTAPGICIRRAGGLATGTGPRTRRLMVLLLLRLFATLVHVAAMFGGAPLLMGVVNKLRARLLGRQGAPITQPYRDLRKLILKTPLIPDNANRPV